MQTESAELGYWAIPDEPGPGVIIVHDVWGLYDHFRDLARRFADQGYVALAIDLYQPLGAVKIEDVGAWMRSLSDPEILSRVQLAVDAMQAHPRLAGKVGIVGFCMGGTYALLASASVRGLGAAAAFYGILSHEHGLYADSAGLDPRKKPRDPLEAAPDIRCPLLGLYGEEDSFIPLADVRQLEQALKSVPYPTAVQTYPGAGHAFFNDTRATYRPEAARDAWERVLAFFRKYLTTP